MPTFEEVNITEPLGVHQRRLADLCPESGDRVKLLRPVLGSHFRNATGAVQREVFAVAGQFGKVTEVQLTENSSRDRASVCFGTNSCMVPINDLGKSSRPTVR